MKVTISNGHDKFHMSKTALICEKNGILNRFITGGYPNNFIDLITKKKTIKIRAIERLLNRRENIPINKINSLWISEILNQISNYTGSSLLFNNYSLDLKFISLYLYGLQSKKLLKNDSPNIFHYRSGYGGTSVKYAKEKKIITICDHSIAEPRLINYYINNNGSLPRMKITEVNNNFERLVLSDLELSDYILVNSNFVKTGLVFQGFNPSKIKVIYLGVDDEFFDYLKCARIANLKNKPIKILFAGHFCKRKGANLVINALNKILKENSNLDWVFEIAGGIDKDIILNNEYFFQKKNILMSGYLTRQELASAMKNTDIFIFPSLAEGSARVIFEAMAAGCYIITTNNSGSIVQEGIHGSIVNTSSAENLSQVIDFALKNMDLVKKIGKFNVGYINENYRQSHYSNNLINLYTEVLCE